MESNYRKGSMETKYNSKRLPGIAFRPLGHPSRSQKEKKASPKQLDKRPRAARSDSKTVDFRLKTSPILKNSAPSTFEQPHIFPLRTESIESVVVGIPVARS